MNNKKQQHLLEIENTMNALLTRLGLQSNRSRLLLFFRLMQYKTPPRSSYQYKHTKIVNKKLFSKLEELKRFLSVIN